MTTWLTLAEAAHYAKAGKRCLYAAVRDGRLKAARINQRGDLRFTPEWLDAWLVEMTEGQWCGPEEFAKTREGNRYDSYSGDGVGGSVWL